MNEIFITIFRMIVNDYKYFLRMALQLLACLHISVVYCYVSRAA